jgi:uroporphyrinogen-III synthase
MKQTLYLGIDIPPHFHNKKTIHCPLIQVIPRSNLEINQAFANLEKYTHIIFTSRKGVYIFFDFLQNFEINKDEISHKILISVGKRTAEKLEGFGFKPNLIASEETAEGIIKAISLLDLKNSHFFLPQSSLARRVIANWLKDNEVNYTACQIYDTMPSQPEQLPNLQNFDEIVFTSPSVVDAFITIFGSIPQDKILSCIGPVTQGYLHKRMQKRD